MPRFTRELEIARYIVRRDEKEVMRLLSSGVQCDEFESANLLQLSVLSAMLKITRRVLELKICKPDSLGSVGITESALNIAIRTGQTAMALLLLEHQADPVAAPSRAHPTPLSVCATYGRQRVAAALIALPAVQRAREETRNRAQADASLAHGLGESALHAAVRHGHLRVLHTLLQSGDAWMVRGVRGTDSPLALAVELGDVLAYEMLLEVGGGVESSSATGDAGDAASAVEEAAKQESSAGDDLVARRAARLALASPHELHVVELMRASVRGNHTRVLQFAAMLQSTSSSPADDVDHSLWPHRGSLHYHTPVATAGAVRRTVHPLLVAAQHGDESTIRILAAHGRLGSAHTKHSAWLEAMVRGHFDALRALQESGASACPPSACEGHPGTQPGVPPSACEDDGGRLTDEPSALAFAIDGGEPTQLQYALGSLGAGGCLRERDLSRALKLAASGAWPRVNLIHKLLRAGAREGPREGPPTSIDASTSLLLLMANNGTHDSHVAIATAALMGHHTMDAVRRPAEASGMPTVAQAYPIDAADHNTGHTALMLAVQQRRGMLVQLLASRGANTELLSHTKQTALGMALSLPSAPLVPSRGMVGDEVRHFAMDDPIMLQHITPPSTCVPLSFLCASCWHALCDTTCHAPCTSGLSPCCWMAHTDAACCLPCTRTSSSLPCTHTSSSPCTQAGSDAAGDSHLRRSPRHRHTPLAAGRPIPNCRSHAQLPSGDCMRGSAAVVFHICAMPRAPAAASRCTSRPRRHHAAPALRDCVRCAGGADGTGTGRIDVSPGRLACTAVRGCAGARQGAHAL